MYSRLIQRFRYNQFEIRVSSRRGDGPVASVCGVTEDLGCAGRESQAPLEDWDRNDPRVVCLLVLEPRTRLTSAAQR